MGLCAGAAADLDVGFGQVTFAGQIHLPYLFTSKVEGENE